VVAVPVAPVVTTEAHVAEEIALVPIAEVPEAIVTVHVAQAIVPVVVIVPPVMGEVVAIDVTVPVPAEAQVPSPRQKVDEEAPLPPFSREVDRLPDEMFAAFVVSVVAEAANAVPLVFVQTTAPVEAVIVQSPVAVKPPRAPELLY
jgi:hypothetical protein